MRVVLEEDAVTDLRELDGAVRRRALAKLMLIERDPNAGRALGRKPGIVLPGYRKLRFRGWRIIYDLSAGGQGAVILHIGSQSDMECYLEVEGRLSQMNDPGRRHSLEQVIEILKAT